MRSPQQARREQSQHRAKFVELLEGRQFYCATAANDGASDIAATITPAVTVKQAIIGPSALEHTYKGVVTGNDGASYEIKLILTPTSARLTVEGLGTYTSALSAKQFLAMRRGTFSVKFTGIDGAKGSITCTGKVFDAGVRITGTYINSADRTGTFSFKS